MLRSLAALALVVATPSAPDALPVPADPTGAIVQVLCFGDHSISAGTAFRVGNGVLLSANHVTSAPGQCFIDGKPIALIWKSPATDFSMIHTGTGPFVRVDCGGFVKGRRYIALGYARGLPSLTAVELVGTGAMDGDRAILVGIFAVVPGQSGGPILDAETGAVVGIVNAENYERGLSWSVPLAGTPVCKPRIA